MTSRPTRVAILGHVTNAPNAIPLPKNAKRAAEMVNLYNFTRVATPDGRMVDHLAHLKSIRGIPESEGFTVWEMLLCSGLLLRSHLERHGFVVRLVNYIDSDNASCEFAALRDFDPDIVLISTTFVLSQRHLIDIGSQLKAEIPSAYLVAGGHHVFVSLRRMTTAQRAQYVLDSGVEAMVNDSQGEAAVLSICRAWPQPPSSVPNVLWRDPSGTVHENPAVPENNDINWTPIELGGIKAGEVVHIRTARSCGFKCAFCSYPSIAGGLTLMEHDKVIATLRAAKDAGVGALFFVDDTFNVPRKRFEILIDAMISEGLNIPWYSFLRSQYVDEALVGKMAKSGCKGVFLGIESGSNKILKNMKKGAAVDFYRRSIKWLRAANIIAVGSFILGFPGETEETVEATREFIESSGLEYYFIQPFYYLHHTPVHSRAAEFGLSGEGLFWTHSTMNWSQAIGHVNRLFLDIKNSTFVNPDYTLWEIAYLRSKGMSEAEIKAYRISINDLTRAQMARFGIAEGHLTSRVA